MSARPAAFGEDEGDKPTASQGTALYAVVRHKQAALPGEGGSEPFPATTAGCGYEPALSDPQTMVWC